MRLAPLLVIAILPIVSAGTRDYPEITDATQDIDLTCFTPPCLALGAPEIDIIRVWSSANVTTFRIHWELVDSAHRIQLDEARVLFFSAEDAGERISIQVLLFPDRTSAWASRTFALTGARVAEDGNVVTAEVPRSFFEGTTLTKTRAAGSLGLKTGESTWFSMRPGFWDDAPNAWGTTGAQYGGDIPLT